MAILSTLQTLHHPLFNKHNVRVEIKRDDIIHPIISGNKWRKLKYIMLDAFSSKLDTIVTCLLYTSPSPRD